MDPQPDSATGLTPLRPPEHPDLRPGGADQDWAPLPAADPLAVYLADQLWPGDEPPTSWCSARLSGAVHLYRETDSGWTVAAKFYAAKTSGADRHAAAEYDRTRQAASYGLQDGARRAIQPLAVWRGVLLLEYVDGLTLEDAIAIRRSRPGTLLPALDAIGGLLAALHTHGAQPDAPPAGPAPFQYGHALIDNLSQHGVLQGDPIIAGGLVRAVDAWMGRAVMGAYTPSWTHGDATTTNFVLPWPGGVVALDWERFEVADPAADVGRLMAEVSHSIQTHGGSAVEADRTAVTVLDAYRGHLPAQVDGDALGERACYYRATSTLRIARNGWIPRLHRLELVAQALALLAAG